MFSQIDKNFMRMALNEAKNCYNWGDLPVGAVLTIDNNLEGSGGNSAKISRDWTSHAESSLLHKLSWKIKNNRKGFSRLYTTWEPCLMCTGAAILSRIDEIVYACSDPFGGMAKINPGILGEWNEKHWPCFRQGPFKQESYNLLTKYMDENKNIWGNFFERFKDITL